MSVSFLTIDGEIVSETRNGVRTVYLNDPLGSVVELSDSAQTITAKKTYWPFGAVQAERGSWTTNKGYTGACGGASNYWGAIYNQAKIMDAVTY